MENPISDLTSTTSAFRTESVEVVVPYVHGIAVGALVALGILDLGPITPAFGTQSVEVVVPGVYGETLKVHFSFLLIKLSSSFPPSGLPWWLRW